MGFGFAYGSFSELVFSEDFHIVFPVFIHISVILDIIEAI